MSNIRRILLNAVSSPERLTTTVARFLAGIKKEGKIVYSTRAAFSDFCRFIQIDMDKMSYDVEDESVQLQEIGCLCEQWLVNAHRQFPVRLTKSVVRRFASLRTIKFSEYKRRYVWPEKVADGSTARVYVAEEPGSGRRRAIKVVRLKDTLNRSSDGMSLRDMFICEVDTLSSMDHPCIVKISDAFIINDREEGYLVTEFAGHTTLGSLRPRNENETVSETIAKHCCKQILLALAYIHAKGYIHKDVKPENVMICEKSMQVKLIDFGISERRIGGRRHYDRAAYAYAAPELIAKDYYDHRYDSWSVGVMLFELLTSQHPVKGRVADKASKMNLLPLEFVSYSEAALSFAELMLSFDRSMRPDAATALRHPWFVHESLSRNASIIHEMEYLSFNVIGFSEQDMLLRNLLAFRLDSNDNEVRQLAALFLEIDEDMDGEISRAEFLKYMRVTGQAVPVMGSIPDMLPLEKFGRLDVCGRGMLSYTEFVAGAYRYDEAQIAEIHDYFSRERKITMRLLHRLVGGSLSLEQFRPFFARIQKDKSTTCTVDDIVAYLREKAGYVKPSERPTFKFNILFDTFGPTV